MNRELERQFGYAREELVGQVVELLLPETLRPIQAVHRDGFVQSPWVRAHRCRSGARCAGERTVLSFRLRSS